MHLSQAKPRDINRGMTQAATDRLQPSDLNYCRTPHPSREGWGRGAAQTLQDFPEPQDYLQEGELEPLQ